jgi:hypothetical protein
MNESSAQAITAEFLNAAGFGVYLRDYRFDAVMVTLQDAVPNPDEWAYIDGSGLVILANRSLFVIAIEGDGEDDTTTRSVAVQHLPSASLPGIDA